MIGRLSLRAALASVAIALAGTALADEELATATTEETSAEVEASPEAATGEEATTEGEIAEDPSPPSLRLYSRYAYICSLDIALGATPETLEGHEYETRYRILEEWSESHAVTERREIRKISANDSVRIVGRSWKSETDGYRLLLELVNDSAESEYECLEAQVEILRIRRKSDRVNDIFSTTHGAEYHIGTTGIQREDDS